MYFCIALLLVHLAIKFSYDAIKWKNFIHEVSDRKTSDLNEAESGDNLYYLFKSNLAEGKICHLYEVLYCRRQTYDVRIC